MQDKLKKKVKDWAFAFIWMGVIFFISSLTSKEIVSAGLGPETYHVNGHFLLFFILTISYFKATKDIRRAILLTILYAFFDEYHQSFVPGRSVSMFDIFVDTAGACLAGGVLWKLIYLLPKPLRNWLQK